MALRLNGSTSGYVEIDAPAVAGDNTLTLPSTPNGSLVALDSSGRLLVGTSSDFTGGTATSLQTVAASGGQLALGRDASSLSSGNLVGRIRWFSNVGGTAEETARITVEADGTYALGDKPSRLMFATTASGASTPTERMRISSDGTVWIGLTGISNPGLFDTSANLKLYSNSSTTSGLVALESQNNSTGLRYHFVFSNINGIVGSISTNASATAYTTSSDYRLKENVTAVTDGITRLQQLKPSRFNFIADPDTIVDGFIAHEAQEVVPECVTGEKNAVDDEGNPVYQGIDQSKLVPLLTAALQEAIAKIESLEARITALEVTP
jgi:hypothetical protein